ncbi:MAG: putative Fe-S cluster assembly protein SufT [Deltaproteobacteria bacterium]|nr:putative Fe-S cluster assembly protein SufT [Deltaproteobacteria bacterium]
MSDSLVTLGGDAEGSRWISVRRAVQAIVIPDGYPTTLEQNEQVRLTQQLGDAFTVMNVRGQLFRIAGDDADALGKEKPTASTLVHDESKSLDDRVWDALRTCYDPEIPANIVDLGLIYGCDLEAKPDGTNKVTVRMTLTAPGCGMSGVLKQDVESKLARIPGVSEAGVEVTFDPPWTQDRMSEAAKLQLGFM